MKVEDLISIPKKRYEIYTNREFNFNNLSQSNQDKVIKMINLIAEASEYRNDIHKIIDKGNKNLERFLKDILFVKNGK